MAQKKEEAPSEFVVKPFAIMRVTHEAIRAGMDDVVHALDTVDDKCSNLDDFKKVYCDLERCIINHAQHEDKILFPLLNAKFDDVVTKNKIFETHENDEQLREKISLIFKNGCESKGDLIELITGWIDAHEVHLKLEEQVLMPILKTTAETVEERGQIVRQIINVNRKEFSDYQFEYVLRQLVKTKPFGPILMWCKAAQMSSNADEYDDIRSKIEGIVGAEMWQKLKSKGVDEKGKQKRIYTYTI